MSSFGVIKIMSICFRTMSTIKPSGTVKDMKVLDKTAFFKKITVPCLRINRFQLEPAKKYIKKYLIKLENFKPVQEIQDSEDKQIILRPEIKNVSNFEEKDREQLTKLIDGVSATEDFPLIELSIGYEQFRGDDILKAVLPLEGLSSYSKIGHIVHVNLHEHLIPYKQFIGQVLLDKVPGVRTVVNKTTSIDNTYRNFQMEILNGDPNLITKVKENHCSFELDFGLVYWNPRLSTEHERIVNLLKSGDVLYDVFAGVGPFSIPAAKKRVCVFANDLNPESYKWLQRNVKLNKTVGVQCFNKDGREFIKEELSTDLKTRYKNNFTGNIHVIMNLPALASTFLDAFYGVLPADTMQGSPLMVHVYCFVFDENPEQSAVALIRETLPECQPNEVTLVRKVSPSKDMMRVSFEMPFDVLTPESPECKKPRLMNTI